MKEVIIGLLTIATLLLGRDLMTGGSNESFETLLNIYGEPLKQCRNQVGDSGSWDSSGKCSEMDGGVHQICINEIAKKAPKFSSNTGQSNWSDGRGNNNHCVCLGAWSLYNAKNKRVKNKKILKCDAIPKNAFSEEYVSKFSTWNGHEVDGQIKDGVEALFLNCYDKRKKNQEKMKHLKENYCRFAQKLNVLKNSQVYKNHCL
tara:strand:- start:250 stop:858 length:609 start_codon:yes stop_codon:yes gene_type:complete